MAEIPIDFLTNFNNDLNNATSVIEQRDVISNSLEGMANQSSLNSPNTQDKFNIKINFFEKLLNELLKNIVKVMLSTHIITIFLINFKIIYGKDERFKDVNDFFLKNKNNIKFSLITSFAMFYDVTNPNKFCSDIEKLLDDNGIWVCEFSYFPLLLKNLTYDQICHEHVAYYTLSTFKSIVTKNGLKILDCNLNKINGGSIEIICAKKKSHIKSQEKKIENIIEDENLISEKSYKKFNLRINNIKILLNNFLLNLSQKKVFAYGASTKGNIVLNHCNITYKKIKYVCDDNFSKIGKYTPGSNIKIISKNLMRKLSPQYLLVLIWPFKSEVIKQEIKFIKNGGKLIFHLPALHIVDKENYKSYLDNDLSLFSYGY
jgi:hypothetical protein